MITAISLPGADSAFGAGQLRLNTFPKSVIGLWAFEPGDCEHADHEGHLVIAPRSATFFASAYDIDRITRQPDGSWRGSGMRAEEGEERRTRGILTLKRLAPDRLSVRSPGAPATVYYRCKDSGR